jgi:heavy metal efflux system protein
MGPNLADTFVILKKEYSDDATKKNLYAQLSKELTEKFPTQTLAATQPIEMRFNEILEGSRADVTLRVFGQDLKELMRYTAQAEEIIRGIRGTQSVELDALTALKESPVLDIRADKKVIARYGVALQEVNRALEMAMSGIRVGSYYDQNIRLPIMLHLDESRRNNLKQIAAIPVGLTAGGTAPLGQLTHIKETQKVTTISRYYGKRYAAIAIYLKDRDIQSFVQEAKEKIKVGLKLPFGYSTYWAGQFKNLEKARLKLQLIVPMTLLIIFFLLWRSFRSARDALLIFLSIPFAMTGGVMSLWLAKIPFSIPAAVGFIALAGIAILNAMVMVSFFRELTDSGRPIAEVIRKGAKERLRPVVMTALVASLGFLPMALGTGLGSEVQRPLATVVIGGLITTTILTLLLLPALYGWAHAATRGRAGAATTVAEAVGSSLKKVTRSKKR